MHLIFGFLLSDHFHCRHSSFRISDSNLQQNSSTKTARACDACYDTVFPVIHPLPLGETITNINNGNSHKSDTTILLWLSMPLLPGPHQPHTVMAIHTTCSSSS